MSYYFHWSSEDVLGLEHSARRRWCKEVSDIHKSINPTKKSKEKSILEMRPSSAY